MDGGPEYRPADLGTVEDATTGGVGEERVRVIAEGLSVKDPADID